MTDTFTTAPFEVSQGYLQFPVTTNANTLLQQALAAIQSLLSGWVPRESHIEVLLLEQMAAMTAESAQVAANVPLGIFTYFGQLVNILPETGAPAECVTTWNFVDTAGYQVPAGTTVGFSFLGNSLYLFSNIAAFTVLPGAQSIENIVIQAQVSGASQNGFAPQGLMLVTPTLSFVSSIASTSVTAGGVDPETQAQYINRLSDELQLLSPRPILPGDFAALAVTIPGIARALAIDELSPGRTIPDLQIGSGIPQITAGDANWSNDDVGRTVSAVGVVNGTTMLSTQNTFQATMTTNATETAVVSALLGDLTAAERCVAVCPVDIDGNAVSPAIQDALQAYLESQREVNFLVNIINPTYTAINVTWGAFSLPGFDATLVESDVTTNLSAYLSQANWAGGNQIPPVWDPNENIVRYLSVAAVISETAGVDYISNLSIGAQGGPQGVADVQLPGYAPLTTVGVLNGNVVAEV